MATELGANGSLWMTALTVLTSEKSEVPMILEAATLALTKSEYSSLIGAALRTVKGTAQSLLSMTC